MNTRNKEDIPTRNFKRRRRKNINWRQTTFHVTQKKKENKTERKKQKSKNNNKKQKKKIPAKHREKFSNVPAELTSGKQKWTWNFFQQNIIFQHFLLPNLQNKVTFFKLSLTLLLFRFLSPHGLSLPLPH